MLEDYLELTSSQISSFRKALQKWHKGHCRPLPWKGEKDPYLVWLSEIILQQTKVEQGLPYFEKFKTNFPTIIHLAKAEEDEVLKLWEGLGYYSRARNLHFTAKYISQNLAGNFPSDFNSLKKLKGVGDYTAAAIASFAFNLPHAVVDGNVYRVLSRCFGLEIPLDSSAGKKLFSQLANELLDPNKPGNFNQAMMDLGASVCTPVSPQCDKCPFSIFCDAKRLDLTSKLPVKSKKLKRRTRHFAYLMILQNGGFYIRKRDGNDIWKRLYELPMVEMKESVKNIFVLQKTHEWENLFAFSKNTSAEIKERNRQELTHQRIEAAFCEVEVNDDFCPPGEAQLIWIRFSEIAEFAFPKLIKNYLQQKALSLDSC